MVDISKIEGFVFDQKVLNEEAERYRELIDQTTQINSHAAESPAQHRQIWEWLRIATFAELDEYARSMQQLPEAFTALIAVGVDPESQEKESKSLDRLKEVLPEAQWKQLCGRFYLRLAFLEAPGSEEEKLKEAQTYTDLFVASEATKAFDHGLDLSPEGDCLIAGKKVSLGRSKFALPLISALQQYFKEHEGRSQVRVSDIVDYIKESPYREFFGTREDRSSTRFNYSLATSGVNSGMQAIESRFKGAKLTPPVTKQSKEGKAYLVLSDEYGVIQTNRS